jgi:outer membrane lipoprotein-sorting protein
MRIALSFLFVLLCMQASAQQSITGNQIFEKMYAAYGGKWHKSVSYLKEVQQYPNGVASPKQYWFEAIQYPGNKRMDIGDVTSGNIILLHNDTLYKYQSGKAVYGNEDRGDFFFLSGDMYFMTLDKAKKRFKWFNYDLTKGTESVWNGKPIYVLGATDTAEKVNQLWIDKENLVLLRSLEYEGGKSDIRFEDHVQLPTSWLETKVSFRQDDQLLQEEKYIGYSNTREFSKDLFNPWKATTAKSWYEPGK